MLDYEKLFLEQTEVFARANDEILKLNTLVRVQKVQLESQGFALGAARADLKKALSKVEELDAQLHLWRTEALRLQRKEDRVLAREIQPEDQAEDPEGD